MRSTTLLPLAAFALLAGAAAAPGAKQVEAAAALCRQGGAALASGDLAGATAQFEKALAAVPGFPDAHAGRGRVATLQGRHEAALQEYLAAESGWRRLAAALQELRMQRYHAAQEGIAARQQMVQAYPEGEVETGIQKLPGLPHASDVVQAARIEQEIAALRAADQVVTDPSRAEPPAEIFFLQGNALYRLGRYDEALEKWGDVVRLAPRFGPAYNNMADACYRLGRLDEARTHLRRAEELGVTVNPEFRKKLGL